MIQTKPKPTKNISIYSDILQYARAAAGKKDSVAAILLYSICPVAARLYLSGESPAEVPDNVSTALLNECGGGTWETAMHDSGLEEILPHVRRYIARIYPRRKWHLHMDLNAELAELWERDSETGYLFGLQSAMDKMGGSWESVLEFVRTTAFLVPEWEAGMCIRSSEQCTTKLSRQSVILSAPDLPNNSVEYPVWCWEVQTGKGKRIYIGLLEVSGRHNWLRYGLVVNSKLANGEEWPGGYPLVYNLDRHTGAVSSQTWVAPSVTLDVAKDIYRNICDGPCYAQAHYDINVCLYACGYKHICLDETIPRELPGKKKRTQFMAAILAEKERQKTQREAPK